MAEQIVKEEAAQVERKRLSKVGVVVSDKMDKTVVVAVDNRRRHRLYNKTITRTQKFHAHDPENYCVTGDIVRIEESRPISRKKRWVILEVIQHADRS